MISKQWDPQFVASISVHYFAPGFRLLLQIAGLGKLLLSLYRFRGNNASNNDNADRFGVAHLATDKIGSTGFRKEILQNIGFFGNSIIHNFLSQGWRLL